MTVLTLQPDGTAGYDTFISDIAATTNYGTNTSLYMGKTDVNETYRTLIKFDLSSIPSNAIINSATMSLYMLQENANVNVNWVVWRMLKNWVETYASWEYYMSPGQPWASSGADGLGTDIYNTTALATGTFLSNEAIGWKDISINVSEFQKFINGTYPNYGFGFYENGSYNNTWSRYQFYSSDYNTTPTLRPKFVVDYIIPAGGSQVIWWFKKWWKEQQEKQPKILLPQGVTM